VLIKKSLKLFIDRQRARLNGRPERPIRRGAAREWWRYLLRCYLGSKEELLICTELSGHTWSALWKVLRFRQRYLQLHKHGRYHLPDMPRLSVKQRDELLHMEDLLELDTILLFRRFVDWQMRHLYGVERARQAYIGHSSLDADAIRCEDDEDDRAAAEPWVAAMPSASRGSGALELQERHRSTAQRSTARHRPHAMLC
jgi:hypothetical protein